MNLRSSEVPNTYTLQRDSLANERTFLAWLKTSLVFVSVGIGLAQLGTSTSHHSQLSLLGIKIKIPLADDHSHSSLGHTFAAVSIVLGIITLLMGVFRFYHTQTLLAKEKFPVARASALVLAAATILIGVAILTMASNI